jgi:hypothetical protein
MFPRLLTLRNTNFSHALIAKELCDGSQELNLVIVVHLFEGMRCFPVRLPREKYRSSEAVQSKRKILIEIYSTN